MSVDAGLKQLEVISRVEDGGWEGVPVSRSHRDKRVGESACSIFFHFDILWITQNHNNIIKSKTEFKSFLKVKGKKLSIHYQHNPILRL